MAAATTLLAPSLASSRVTTDRMHVSVRVPGRRSDHSKRLVIFRDGQAIEDRCAGCGDSAYNAMSKKQARVVARQLKLALDMVMEKFL